MNGTRAILTTMALGVGAGLLIAVPANAVPWGQGNYYSAPQATNCNCATPQEAASQTQQSPTEVAKQTNPAASPNHGEAGRQLQR